MGVQDRDWYWKDREEKERAARASSTRDSTDNTAFSTLVQHRGASPPKPRGSGWHWSIQLLVWLWILVLMLIAWRLIR